MTSHTIMTMPATLTSWTKPILISSVHTTTKNGRTIRKSGSPMMSPSMTTITRTGCIRMMQLKPSTEVRKSTSILTVHIISYGQKLKAAISMRMRRILLHFWPA